MKKEATLFVLLIFTCFSLFAQDKMMTIEDATSQNPKLYPASLNQLQWMGVSDSYCYITRNCLIKGNPGSIEKDTILRMDYLNAELTALKAEKVNRFPIITFTRESACYFLQKNRVFSYDILKNRLEEVNKFDEKAGNIDIDRKNLYVAYTRENNLFIALNGKEVTLSQEVNPGIRYGSSDVHRNEWGISKGTFWSPEGNRLAFYRMDESMVTDYPLVNIDERIAQVKNTKYPMAGMKSHIVTIGVFEVMTGTTIYLKTGDPTDKFYTNITWSPDEKYIYMAVLNRDQNHMWLNKYDAATGDFIKTLFEEQNEKYVEPTHGLYFLNNDPGRFIWMSQRDGFDHLYLYNTEGILLKQLTQGNWVVKEILKITGNNDRIYFSCNKDNPIGDQVYALEMKSGELIRISEPTGTHRDLISADGKFILDNFNSLTIANQVELADKNGKKLEVLLENMDPLKDYKLGKTTIFTLKNVEGTDLYCRLIRPADFDSTRKYPVIIYVYGGPHSQMVTDSWLGGAWFFLNYLAEQGYVVFTLDNRGTGNRGLTFEQVIFRNLGTAEVADQMTGVKYLKSLSWVDSTRIGIHGWSYGGFMTLSMMLKDPGIFKVAVAGGPVIDWKYYEVMYGERYMDTPESNPEGYKNACLLNYVKNLKGKVLIIQGYQDKTVVPQNSLSFLKKCVDENIQVDYFLYPDQEHNIRGKGRIHLNQKIVNYLKDYL